MSRRPARPACCHIAARVPGYPVSTAASSDPMSMPSSSALVEATASSSPVGEGVLDAPPVLREVAGAVARDPLAQLRVADLSARPLGEQLGRPA